MYQGLFPQDLNLLMELPGIGPSTAAAILSQAYNLPTAILDGNVKRVLTRFFRIEGYTEQAAIKKMLWQLADECMPRERCADYTQAIMDLGATCCTLKKPQCTQCPLQSHCQALKHQEQHLYPTKKIKKAVPLQHQQFLVLRNKQQMIYLEKRPPVGLWGGLWCLPGLEKERCPLTYIQDQYNLQGTALKHILSLKHRFSHFHLEIDALMIDTHVLKDNIAETNGQWFTQEQLVNVGLAKPTSQILEQVFS
jgi:A/G-specific adenine glycosylase